MSNPRKRGGLPERVRMRHGTHFVDTLAARSDEPVGKMVPTSSVEPDPDQPRHGMGDLSDLTQSIRDKGILEPILVRPMPEDGDSVRQGQLRIISGERRYRAALEAGLSELPVIVMDVSDDEALEIALIENLQRKDLTPFEEGDGYRSLAERFGYTHEQIAKAVGKSRTVITESLQLLTMPAPVRQAAQALGIHSKSLLLEVLKAEQPDEMIRLLEEVSRRGLNRDDLRRKQRAQQPAGKTTRRKPFVFNFRSPDRSYSLALKFRQSDVSRMQLIDTLEHILRDLRDQDAREHDPRSTAAAESRD
ncbi:MAG: ParB/RepB/Spo0J family partition protein [Acidobacteriota bacterium]